MAQHGCTLSMSGVIVVLSVDRAGPHARSKKGEPDLTGHSY